MGSIQPKFTDGPVTCEAVELIVGGQLVEARAGGVDNPGCGVAADVSTKVLGVAQKDATPGGGAPRAMTGGVLDVTLQPTEVAVISDGFVKVTYGEAAAYGQRLVAAALGQVKPYASGTHTADMIVGRCHDKAGVAQGAVGLTRINL